MDQTLLHRLNFEKLVTKISNRFISFEDINEAILKSLEDIGRFRQASRSYVFMFSEDENTMINTHEWCQEGVVPKIKNLQGLSMDMFPWWIEKLKNRQIILIQNVSKLTEEAQKEKEMLEEQGIVSVMVLPIYVQRKLTGFIGFDNVSNSSEWQEEDISLLQLTAEIFSNAIERMRAEKALKSSERKFREMFHNVNDIICVNTFGYHGKPPHFIEVNEFMCKNTGYTREELLAMSPYALCSPEFIPSLTMLEENIRKTNHITYEMEYVTKDGKIVPLEMNSHVFVLDGQSVVMSIGRGVSDLKNMEKALKENNEELQTIIQQLKETQSRLIQQEQLAGIGQLAAGVAHEINNPLAFIISNSSVLQSYIKQIKQNATSVAPEEIIEEMIEIVADIQEGLMRVDTIVKGLTTFSRIDCQEELHEFDLNEGIKSTLIVAKNEYKYYSEIDCQFAILPKILGNPGQINQVLLNIILNAAYSIKTKYSSQNIKGLILIKTYQQSNNVYCEIEDNGTGIADEVISKIFNPFYTTKPVGEGTGLGLSIAYDIMVNKQHGDIKVDSKLTEGTKFVLRFPL